jgi:hypothetical protein
MSFTNKNLYTFMHCPDTPVCGTPAHFAATIKHDIVRWAKVVNAARFED